MSDNNHGSAVSLYAKYESSPEDRKKILEAVKEAMKDKSYKIPSIIDSPHEAAAVQALGALPDYTPGANPDSLPSKDDVEVLTAMFKVHSEYFAKKQLEHVQSATNLVKFISESFEKLYQEFGEEEYKQRLGVLEEIEQKMLVWYVDSHPLETNPNLKQTWSERANKEGSFDPFGYPEDE